MTTTALERIDNGENEIMHADSTPPASVQVASSRAVAEVQAAMTVAKRFPRTYEQSYARAMAECRRPSLAEKAVYLYKRGGQAVTGPSIRLAEVLVRAYGNMDFGIVELERRNGSSSVLAYAVDLETNTRRTLAFDVKHVRDTKDGRKILTDERDIYEVVANQGARRQRSCMLALLPGDFVEDAVLLCMKTRKETDAKVPMADKVKKLASNFLPVGVTVEMLKARAHVTELAQMSEETYGELWHLLQAIREGVTSVADAFALDGEGSAPVKTKSTDKLKAEMKGEAKPDTPPAKDGA